MAEKKFQYLCSHDMRAENPVHKHLVAAFRKIAEDTNGRLEVEVLPWGGAGPSKVSLRKLLDNELQFHPISGMPLSTIVPIAAMEGLPYAYPTEREAFRIFDGPFGNMLRREISAKGIHMFPHIWYQGFNQISTSTGPLRNVDDLKGFKLRIAQVPYKQDLFSALGCEPVQVHYQGIYDALVDGRAEGEETPYLYIEIDHFADVQTNIAVTNHRFASFWLAASVEGWKALPEDIKASVERRFAEQVVLYREDMLAANEAAGERLKKRLVFNDFDAASAVRRLKEVGFYDRWRKEFGEKAWTLLEESRGRKYPD